MFMPQCRAVTRLITRILATCDNWVMTDVVIRMSTAKQLKYEGKRHVSVGRMRGASKDSAFDSLYLGYSGRLTVDAMYCVCVLEIRKEMTEMVKGFSSLPLSR